MEANQYSLLDDELNGVEINKLSCAMSSVVAVSFCAGPPTGFFYLFILLALCGAAWLHGSQGTLSDVRGPSGAGAE